ncbi:hypothetical protein NC651_033749 [Populus alba x Populus x berolinensis]|uniref:Uncharacterized protein n=1 Tax=Populus alba x Populus x berolinensis TaxID=444605 RepID=A0AAD6LNM3_9ROSI|nr:hypothetical protein NC651_033749 [Populus alba x Populus x berolinensis]KAJ6970306.1 hypothetical protein NC653_034796 [Populus alba x Populus x berolinensis]
MADCMPQPSDFLCLDGHSVIIQGRKAK